MTACLPTLTNGVCHQGFKLSENASCKTPPEYAFNFNVFLHSSRNILKYEREKHSCCELIDILWSGFEFRSDCNFLRWSTGSNVVECWFLSILFGHFSIQLVVRPPRGAARLIIRLNSLSV